MFQMCCSTFFTMLSFFCSFRISFNETVVATFFRTQFCEWSSLHFKKGMAPFSLTFSVHFDSLEEGLALGCSRKAILCCSCWLIVARAHLFTNGCLFWVCFFSLISVTHTHALSDVCFLLLVVLRRAWKERWLIKKLLNTEVAGAIECKCHYMQTP